MNAEDILNNTDPRELRNILKRLKLKSESFQRPVPNIIINEAPQQFPPSTTTVINKMPWFNVRDYGAIGDGSANDTAAVNTTIAALNTAARGVLYFPAGKYKCTSALTAITADCIILGDGPASFDDSTYSSSVVCTSATAVLFTVTSAHAKFIDLEILNTATVSAGAGIQVSGSNPSQKVDYDGVRVSGFYINIDIQVGAGWIMNNCAIHAPALYGVKIANSLNPEGGGWTISNCSFHGAIYNSDAAIRVESSGAGKIVNCDINYSVSSPETDSLLVHDIGYGFIYTTDLNSGNHWHTMNSGLTSAQYQNANFMFVCPNGSVYCGLRAHDSITNSFIARADTLGGAWTIIEDATSALAKYSSDANTRIFSCNYNPLAAEQVCYVMGINGSSVHAWIGSDGSYSQGVSLGALSRGLISYGNNQWRIAGKKIISFVLTNHYWLLNTAASSVSSEANSASDFEGVHYSAGTTPIIYANRTGFNGLYKYVNNFIDTPTYINEDLDGGQGFAADYTGSKLMAEWGTGERGNSSDGGTTWATLSSLTNLHDYIFCYMGGNAWAAAVSAVMYSPDYGASWTNCSGDITSISPTPAIDMVCAPVVTGTYENGIDINSSVSGFFVIANCIIRNIRGHGIKAAGSFDYLTISGVQFGLSDITGNNSSNAININGVDDVIIIGCTFVGGTTPAAISLTSVTGARIVGNLNVTFSSLVSQSSCSGVVIIEPGTSVTAETSYGAASAVGTSGYYARQDHTHGTPSLSTATPAEVASSGAAGSGTTPSKDDHAHKGVHSLAKSGGSALYGDVTLSEGSNVTITPSGNNLEISSTGGGGGSLTVEEQDAAPSVASVTTIKVSNGTLTDEGSGVVSIDTSGGAGSGADPVLAIMNLLGWA